MPSSLARLEARRLRSCPHCQARRWAIVETPGGIRAGCLRCGFAAADVLTPVADAASTTDPPRRRLRDRVRWIAHAGLAPSHSGGTATRTSLDRAMHIGADTIELDACVTLDGYIVIRHDVRVRGDRRRVHQMTLTELRHMHPQTLTLPEAVEHLGSTMEILLDVKDSRATAPLVRWLRDRRGRSGLVVCCPNPEVLLELRRTAPAVERWRSLPSMGTTRAGAVAGVAGALAQACAQGRAGSVAAELRSAGEELMTSPRTAACRFVGSPWRRELPSLLARVTGNVGAAGLSVDHRLVSPELCHAATARGLRLVAWTVNAADHLTRALDNGVREVTTDDVVRMRLAMAGIAG